MAAEKRPTDDAAAAEPAAKAARTEECKEMEPEWEPAEREANMSQDSRQKVTDLAQFNPSDMTLNVVPTTKGRILMTLSDSGMQYLVAAARGNFGVTAGRYMYEVKILEVLSPVEGGRRSSSAPRQHLRVGFSTSYSALYLGDTEESVCFDSEGIYMAEKKRSHASPRFARGHVVAVVLNLDKDGPNANTVSLFRDGKRVSLPQPLPQSLVGKPLFPHVAFRNISVQVHFGPEPIVQLPFKCRCLQDAAQEDISVSKVGEAANGKYEVLFPVGLPDEGTFQWLEGFLEKNPKYVELSDRKVVEWAERSGLQRQRGYLSHSNDQPDANFGVPSLDDFSIRKMIRTVASVVPRHYVVMEVRGNLLKHEREAVRRCFAAPHFKPVVRVVMGEPSLEYKSKVWTLLLAEKQQRVEHEWKVRKADRERKRMLEQRRKEALTREKAAAEAAAAEAAAAEAAAAEAAAAEAEDLGNPKGTVQKLLAKAKAAEEAAEAEAKKQGEGIQDEKKEEEVKEDEAKEEAEEDKGPPKAELSEEELKTCFKPQALPDLTEQVLAESFANFTIPEESEGFAEIAYEWDDKAASHEYLRKWILAKKLTTPAEDLQPSEWFFAKLTEWQGVLQDWQLKQKEFRQDPIRREAAKARVQKEREKKEKEDKGREEGGEALEEEKEEAQNQEDEAAVDIFTVQDVCDIGDGEPLFANFMFEDWALMSLRFELFLLVRSFQSDVNDPDRPGMPEAHLPFYYNKYYMKALSTRFFGANTTSELVAMVKDTIITNPENSLLCAQLPDNQDPVSDIFVKLTEEARRNRQLRIDAGDETAKLRFSVMQVPGEKGGPRVISPMSRNYQRGYGQQPQRSGWGWTQQGHGYTPKQQGPWR